MNTIKIAFRNMTRQKKRSILLAGAVGFGIFIISLVSALTGGLVANVKDNFSQLRAGHVYVEGNEVSALGREISIIRDDSAISAAVVRLDVPVKSITKRSSVMGTLIFGSREQMQRVDGIDWDSETFFRKKLMLVHGSLDELGNPQALILSENGAAKLGVEVGETLLIRLLTATGQQNVGEFKLIATTIDQSIVSTMTAYGHLQYINELLNIQPHEYQSLNIFLEEMESMDQAAEQLYALMAESVQMAPREDETVLTDEEASGPGVRMRRMRSMSPMGGMLSQEVEETWEATRYTITTLNDILGPLMDFVDVLNISILIILAILLLIVMVGIANTFQMILIERVREIGTMRALGMHRGSVRASFLLEALFVCLSGAVCGLLLAFGAMALLHLISFGTDTPLFILLDGGHLSFMLQPVQIVLYILLVSVFSLLAAMWPADKAAKLDPAKALGTHY